MLKNTIKIILTLTLILFASQNADADQPSVLQKLISDAEQNNLLIKAADERVKRAESSVLEAKGKMGPKIGLTAAATWGDEGLYLLVPGLTSTALPVDLKTPI